MSTQTLATYYCAFCDTVANFFKSDEKDISIFSLEFYMQALYPQDLSL